MGFLKKLKFWRKKNTNTPIKVDACVSTDDPQTCDAATVSKDLTVKVDACVSTDDPQTCDAATVSKDLTVNVDACVSTDNPQTCDAATESKDPTVKVDACVSTDDPQTCDAATVSNDPTVKVDACVSADDPQTCDAATVSKDPTVMCAACSQTEETRMDSGAAAAAKQVNEHQPEINTQNVRDLQEQLAVSERFTADLMFNINSVEQQVRNYAEAPVNSWSNDCDCKQKVSAVADLLKTFITMEKDAKTSKPEPTSGTNTRVDCETQTEAKSRQRDCANVDDLETQRELEDKYRKLSVLVDEYQRKIALLKERIENMSRDQQQDKSSDHTGRIEAGESSNCQQSANQCDRPNGRDFGRKRSLPPRLQQAPSRDEEENSVSPEIHEYPTTCNIGQQSTYQGHQPNRNLPPRLQNMTFIIMEKDAKKSKPEPTSGTNTRVDCENQTYQGHRPNRNLPPRLQQAPSRNEEENFVSPEIHEHPTTCNIGQQSTYQGHRPNRNLPPRLQKRNLPPRLQQAPSRDEEENFVSPEIHEHPRTCNIGQQSTNQGHRPNRNLPPRLQQPPSGNEEDNFVSPEIHEHPRTRNIGQQSTYQGHRPNRNLPPRLQNRK